MRPFETGRALLMDQHEPNSLLLAKIASVWAAVGVTSWSEAASFVAFLYTLCLFSRWVWIHGIKPICVRRGWIAAGNAAADAGDEDAGPA